MVGAMALATKDVRSYHVNVGIPAKSVRVKPNAPPEAYVTERVGGRHPGSRLADRGHSRSSAPGRRTGTRSFPVRSRRRSVALEQDRRQLALQLDRRINEIFSLQELSYVLAESLQLERVAEQVVRYTMRFLQADGAIVILAAEDGSSLMVAGAEGSLSALNGQRLAAG